MVELLKFVKEFEGIIGVLLGIIVSTILTQLTKNSGKIRIYVNYKELKTIDYSDWREEIYRPIDEANFLIINLVLDFYNSSEIPKYINNIKIIFYDKENNVLLKKALLDNDTKRLSGGAYNFDVFNHLNIQSKTLLKKELHITIDLNEYNQVREYKEISITYDIGKNRKRSINIY